MSTPSSRDRFADLCSMLMRGSSPRMLSTCCGVMVTLAMSGAGARAESYVEEVTIWWTKNSAPQEITVPAFEIVEIQRDSATAVDIRIRRIDDAPLPVTYWYADFNNGGYQEHETSASYWHFDDVAGPLDTQVFAGVNTTEGCVTIGVSTVPSPYPDLAVSNITVDGTVEPESYEVDQVVDVGSIVWNMGGAPAGASELGYYIGTSPNDFSNLWADKGVPGLEPDHGFEPYPHPTYQFTEQDVGVRYFILRADYTDLVDEGPNEANNARAFGPFIVEGEDGTPIIELAEPATDIFVADDGSVMIVWTDSDPDDNALINLAVDPDLTDEPWGGPNNHQWIALFVEEDPDGAGDEYLWDVSGTAVGTYSIWAMIVDDDHPPAFSAAPGHVTIQEEWAAIEAIDPNTNALLDGENWIKQDVDELGNPALSLADGLAADGVTPLVLRLETPEPGSVQFRIADETGDPSGAGTLKRIDNEEPGGAELEVQTVLLSDGRHMAFAVLQAPKDFVRDAGDHALAHRLIRVEASFVSGRGIRDFVTESWIELHRPPVVLLHGLWGRPSGWTWNLRDDPRFCVQVESYVFTNDQHFIANVLEVQQGVENALQLLRLQDIAVTQVDVFGHSMGGILSRLYINEFGGHQYRRNENFGAGDIHKLITVDTPHAGSQLANWLVVDDGESGQATILGRIIAKLDPPFGSVDRGAVLDLRPESPILQNLSATPVAAHAIVGKGGSDVIQEGIESGLPLWAGAVLDLLQFFGLLEDIFPPALQNDLVVTRSSQEGGLSGTRTSVFGFDLFPPSLGLHITVNKEDLLETLVGPRAIELLNTPITDEATFAPAFPAARAAPPCPPLPARLFQMPGRGGIVITDPLPGTVVVPGEPLPVAVEGVGGFIPVKVLVVSDHDAEFIEEQPFTAVLDVPQEALGEITVSAWAFDADDCLMEADPVSVVAETEATLIELTVVPGVFHLFDFAPSEQLTVIGLYNDDTERDLTSPDMGTEYESDDPSIAAVDEQGFVRAVLPGMTTIRAMNAGIIGEAAVHVQSVPCPADFDGDGDVDTADLLHLLGCWGDGCGDVDGDGDTDTADLLALLGAWGECP